jgi:hypothetical protein
LLLSEVDDPHSQGRDVVASLSASASFTVVYDAE